MPVKKYILIVLVAGLLPGALLAESAYERAVLSVSIGANPTNAVTSTNTVIRGALQEITLTVPAAGVTGNVAIVSVPEVGAPVVLYSNAAVTASVISIPKCDGNGVVSTSGVNDVVLVGDQVRMTVVPVSVSMGVVWKAAIKFAR